MNNDDKCSKNTRTVLKYCCPLCFHPGKRAHFAYRPQFFSGDNLLLTEHDDVKLADFGLAHYLAVDGESNTLSMETDSAGTPLFSAPEVFVDQKYGRGADVWLVI